MYIPFKITQVSIDMHNQTISCIAYGETSDNPSLQVSAPGNRWSNQRRVDSTVYAANESVYPLTEMMASSNSVPLQAVGIANYSAKCTICWAARTSLGSFVVFLLEKPLPGSPPLLPQVEKGQTSEEREPIMDIRKQFFDHSRPL